MIYRLMMWRKKMMSNLEKLNQLKADIQELIDQEKAGQVAPIDTRQCMPKLEPDEQRYNVYPKKIEKAYYSYSKDCSNAYKLEHEKIALHDALVIDLYLRQRQWQLINDKGAETEAWNGLFKYYIRYANAHDTFVVHNNDTYQNLTTAYYSSQNKAEQCLSDLKPYFDKVIENYKSLVRG